ncbi:unnamed protein product, partial [Orchesella dallaii]
MVLKFSLDVMKLQITIGKYLALLPFEWDEKSECFKVTENRHRLYQLKISMNFLFLLYTFSSIRLFYPVFSGSQSPSFLILNTFFASIHAATIVAVIANLASAKSMEQLFRCNKVFDRVNLDI